MALPARGAGAGFQAAVGVGRTPRQPQLATDTWARPASTFRFWPVMPSLSSLARNRVERATYALAMQHNTFSRNTRIQLKQIFSRRRDLMTPLDPP